MGLDRQDGEEIIKRLNIMIVLTLEQSADTALSMTAKITKLNDLGVFPADIARILGKPLNHITASLSQKRGRKKGSEE